MIASGAHVPIVSMIAWSFSPSSVSSATAPAAKSVRGRPKLSNRRGLTGPSAAPAAVTLNEAEPFNCVRCAKPFGTRRMVDAMLGRLAGHSMFAGVALRRLQMCADCRVIDMMENKDEATVDRLDADKSGKP